MLTLKITLKEGCSIIQFSQALFDKKISYYIDTQENQITNLEDGSYTSFLHIVERYCIITAVLHTPDSTANHPFMGSHLNRLFNSLTQNLQEMEKLNCSTAEKCVKEMISLVDGFAVAKVQDETLSDKVLEQSVAPLKSETSANSPEAQSQGEIVDTLNPVAETEECNVNFTSGEESTCESTTADVLQEIPENVRKQMTASELILYPYVYRAIDYINKSDFKQRYKKVYTFLRKIKFPTENYTVKMFYALNSVNGVTYQKIYDTDLWKKTEFNTQEINLKTRDAFRTWAERNCPEALKQNNKLSFITLLKLYKRFVK